MIAFWRVSVRAAPLIKSAAEWVSLRVRALTMNRRATARSIVPKTAKSLQRQTGWQIGRMTAPAQHFVQLAQSRNDLLTSEATSPKLDTGYI